jgi:pentapeptide repeat protein/ion channel
MMNKKRLKIFLVDRWAGEEARVESIIDDLRSGRDWTQNLLRSEELGWDELPGLESCPRAVLEVGTPPRDLRGLRLTGVDLSGVKGMADSCLDYAMFEGVTLVGASFIGASLRGVSITQASVLDRAEFRYSDLSNIDCREISMRGANLTGANLSGADFRGSDMRRVILSGVRYRAEGIVGFLAPFIKRTRFGGDRQYPQLFSRESDRTILRYIAGEGRRELYEASHPAVLSVAWRLLSNYGRSPGRLLLWLFVVWFIFGLIFSGLPLPSRLNGTVLGSLLVSCAPKFCHTSTGKPAFNYIFEPFYFSTVTFTTLGYGDICPVHGDWKSELYVCCEAVLGYLLFGLFVSLMVQNENLLRL